MECPHRDDEPCDICVELSEMRVDLLKATESHDRVQEQFDKLYEMTINPPKGFCRPCTTLWIERLESAINEIEAL